MRVLRFKWTDSASRLWRVIDIKKILVITTNAGLEVVSLKKTVAKIIIAMVTIVLFMMVLPWMAIQSNDGWAVKGLWMFAFFIVNPALVVCLSVMAGTELRRLWWIPLAVSALFPLLFSAAIGKLVWDLYVYSAIYLPIGLLAMFGTHLGMQLVLKRKKSSEGGNGVEKQSI